jgi:hypothetical protein
MILNLLRRKLAQSGIVLNIVEMMNQLTEINEVTLLYPAPQGSKNSACIAYDGRDFTSRDHVWPL